MAMGNSLEHQKASSVSAPSPIVEGETVLPTDTLQPMRIGLWVLGIGFGGFLLWAGMAPLDEGVPTQGIVAIDTKRKAVQHLSGGLVKDVLVKEGQFVKDDQELIRLDDAVARANYESVRQHYMVVRAMEGRLLAEQTGQARIEFHLDLLNEKNDPLIKQHIANQEQLFQSRRMASHAEQQAIEESIQGQMGATQGYEGMLKSRKSQLSLLQEELDGIRDLVKEGYAPRTRQMELERMAADAMGSMADLQGNISRARSSIAELKMRAIQRKQEYRKEVEGQLADVRREVQADAEKHKSATNDLERMVIRAPASGQVVGLAVQTVGGVIQPGQRLMDIVPQNEVLLLETKVVPHLIDSVHPGLLADVRFSSFAHSPQLVVEGKVDSVSGDLITDPQNPNITYYLARISVTAEGLKTLGNRQMQAGMPAEVIIKTGERSVLTYLLHPLLKRISASMKEE
ncbi:MAG: HlyD family type I secretion periplasmic adaptor subunit [Sulfurimicrobium sp.]|nr:HlyD family type I secretion periplasmic adaptor subunit [Sulfurimicrobium sp.]